ncbi:MAG: hypothetical protein FJW66_05980 [Actinobacteria bacterium]|nr:hypothetical protein [Actinomycetota bacterium]
MKKTFRETAEKNIRKSGENKINLILITVFVLAMVIFWIFTGVFAGCKTGTAAAQEVAEYPESLTAEASEIQDASSSTEKETAPATSVTAEKQEETTQEKESATETAEQVPDDITNLIKEADGYYSNGEYGLAKNTYRKAELAINDSDLSEQVKTELINSFYSKYKKSREIIETARTHYANAMQLEYETRYEEAMTELEAALAIYPKYEEAVEAYENLKTLMGLE